MATKIMEYSDVCKSKIKAQIVNKIELIIIESLPTEKPGFVFDKHTPAISIPPQHPLLCKASPTPIPHIKAPKIQFESMSGIITMDCLGKIDRVMVCTTKLMTVLIQNSLFMILNPIKNNGILIIKLMIPTKFICPRLGIIFTIKYSIICAIPMAPPKLIPLGVTNK